MVRITMAGRPERQANDQFSEASTEASDLWNKKDYQACSKALQDLAEDGTEVLCR